MITVRCKECGAELTSTSKVQFCGCPNQMRVVDNKVGANDLDKVVMVSNNVENKIDVISLDLNFFIKRKDVDVKSNDWTSKLNSVSTRYNIKRMFSFYIRLYGDSE